MTAFGCEKIGAQKIKAKKLIEWNMGVAGLDVASKYNEITRNSSNTNENAKNHQTWVTTKAFSAAK